MDCFATPYGLRYAAHCFKRANAQIHRSALIPAGGKLGVTSTGQTALCANCSVVMPFDERICKIPDIRDRCVRRHHCRNAARLDAVPTSCGHDASGQSGGGPMRHHGNVAVMRKMPPQHGHWVGSKCGSCFVVSSTWVAVGAVSIKSWRMEASRARRQPLARKP